MSIPDLQPATLEPIKKLRANCTFAAEMVKHPVPFDPKNLGDNINSKKAEYLPSLTTDEQTLIYTVRVPVVNPMTGQYYDQEDFYISHKVDGEWGQAVLIGPPINTPGNEGAQSISPDGKYLFFTACEREDGFGNCDIYMAEKVGNRWSVPHNLGEVINSPAWDSQPSFSSDGKTLYFLSARTGGFGKQDIYKSMLDADNNWTAPVNMGANFNTSGNEFSPFIHPDDQTLYFGSEGLQGMGGVDIFYARKDEKGNWGKPVNIGYPINTTADENCLVVGASAKIAYFASDREDTRGKKDLYSFDLYKEAQPKAVSYLKGIVFDCDSKANLAAKFELIDLSNGQIIVQSASDKVSGAFLVSLPSGKDYALNVSRPGYLFYSDNFSLKENAGVSNPVLMDVPLHLIKAGQSMVMKNIFFATNAFNLKDESKAELAKLVAFLNTNAGVKIEIGGHTDNTGDKKFNQTLSEKRAKAVYDSLIAAGVSPAKLTFKGYGDSKPIADNTSEEGKAKNRRTEFTIM
jgi:outer membrane protein OmpA-like peptidoglycan-associated protein/Tol biopolymer transport system component